ncbi:aminodeoxychorismate synthase component I [Roseibium sp. RKSG952]|uniref:aminodeoxychorismate synthase component I n=1 Tax=Roseibium sp. RKSG952 TaxID=2529384 RepID=UPI0012BC0DCA|nr:aminodeoxychorismate synthase component I [Roseibium sp. RKSG952]MTI00037.1 aminodeoxychorismate synthase component I [Roseibium sp. RKSG952]
MASFELTEGSVLLLDALHTRRGKLFRRPKRIIECRHLDGVGAALNAVECARASGGHVAGFLAYELGYAFEEKLRACWKPDGERLLWFGVFDAPEDVTLADVRQSLSGQAETDGGWLGTPVFDMGRTEYETAFSRVQQHLAEGDIYQVNLTMRARLRHAGPPERLFADLLEKQPVPHAAFVKLDDRDILSLSPELFLEREGNTVRTRPMKGTAPRGITPDEDSGIAASLAEDPKQRAENTMIVDLMRNDLSRICEPGSVKVTRLCEVERYKSLHQMTSTIEASLAPAVAFPDIIERLFPCGSITGAPKLSAMLIADRLETSPRGVYTGSIGHIEPTGDFRFNVAIRTLDLKRDGAGQAGTGSGVVFDSGANPEYDECALKLKFLSDPAPGFGLFETLAYFPGDGYALLERHLRRLEASAGYFAYPFEAAKAHRILQEAAAEFRVAARVRLDLAPTGDMSISATPMPVQTETGMWRVVLADRRVDPANRFLYHKTTNRAFYDDTRKQIALHYGCQEVIFENTDGFLTEGSFTNLFVRKRGRLLTPAVRHGLLPGTFRAGLLEHNLAHEADLTSGDLREADAVFVGNSVRGLIEARVHVPSALKQAS